MSPTDIEKLLIRLPQNPTDIALPDFSCLATFPTGSEYSELAMDSSDASNNAITFSFGSHVASLTLKSFRFIKYSLLPFPVSYRSNTGIARTA